MVNRKIVLAAGAALAVAGLSASTASAALIASYTFNNTSASDVPDDSGNLHTGTFRSGTGYNTVDTPAGVGGAGSLQLNGAGDVSVAVAGLTSFNDLNANNAGTAVFWLKSGADNATAFGLYDGGGGRVFQAHLPWSDGTVYFDTAGCCDADTRLTIGDAGDAASWNHWAFVKNGNDKFIYKNGTLIQSQLGTATAALPTVGSVTIGSENGNIPDSGLIDEVAFFSHALDEAAIDGIIANGVPVPEPTALGLLGLGGLALIRRRRA